MFKTDALDHGDGHDLVGPQDIAWDLAGAAVELSLNDQELASLAQVAQRAPVSPRKLELFRVCYLSFQVGRLTLSVGAHARPDERERLAAQLERYRTQLRCLLEGRR